MNTILASIAAFFLLASMGNFAFAQYDDKLAVLETNQGLIVMEFFPDDAPNHVANFVELTESGFYDGTLFHRIIPGFMIQGGDPNTIDGDPRTWGTGGPDTAVDAEFNDIKHNRGIVSMARSADPNSAGSQFFIVHQNSNFLDQQYTVFGRIVTDASYETLDKIASVETVKPGDAPVNPDQVRLVKASIIERLGPHDHDLLSLGDPERTTPAAESVQNQLYENEDLGVTFSAPPGWLLQQPEKLDQNSPDVVAVGPKNTIIQPYISLTVKETNGMTFDEIVQEKKQELEQAVQGGNLEIISQEESTTHDREAFTTLAMGSYQSGGQSLDVKFKEIVIYDPEKLYTLSYVNVADDFEAQLPSFDDSVEAFEILGDADADDQNEGGGCLVATAAFGSELAPTVQMLREVRDSKVMNTETGSAFMAGFNQLYYSFSPGVADLQRQSPVFKEAVKLAITPMLSTLSLLNHVDIDSEHDILGYGIAIIMLNLGMYVAAPAMIVYRIRK